MNISTHLRMSFGYHQPQPVLFNKVSPLLESNSIRKVTFYEKRVDRDINREELLTITTSHTFSPSPPRLAQDDENGLSHDGQHKKNPQPHGVPSRAFYSVVLVLTVVEPYLHRLEYFQSTCTGTFISANVVLTLASCVRARDLHKVEPNPAYTKIYTRDGLILSSFKIYVYHEKSQNQHYALIMLERPYRSDFPKLPKTSLNFSQMKNSCVLAGFGNQNRLQMSNFRARPLKNMGVTKVECRAGEGLCLHFKNLQACMGDKGSPLICDGVIYSIFAPERFKPPHRCIGRYSTTFLPVLPAGSWIASVAGSPHALAWFGNRWYLLITCIIVLAVISAIYYLLSLCVIKPFNRRLDSQLVEHALSLETRNSRPEGSGGSAGSKRLGERADQRGSAAERRPGTSSDRHASGTSNLGRTVKKLNEGVHLVQRVDKRRKNP